MKRKLEDEEPKNKKKKIDKNALNCILVYHKVDISDPNELINTVRNGFHGKISLPHDVEKFFIKYFNKDPREELQSVAYYKLLKEYKDIGHQKNTTIRQDTERYYAFNHLNLLVPETIKIEIVTDKYNKSSTENILQLQTYQKELCCFNLIINRVNEVLKIYKGVIDKKFVVFNKNNTNERDKEDTMFYIYSNIISYLCDDKYKIAPENEDDPPILIDFKFCGIRLISKTFNRMYFKHTTHVVLRREILTMEMKSFNEITILEKLKVNDLNKYMELIKAAVERIKTNKYFVYPRHLRNSHNVSDECYYIFSSLKIREKYGILKINIMDSMTNGARKLLLNTFDQDVFIYNDEYHLCNRLVKTEKFKQYYIFIKNPVLKGKAFQKKII